MKNHWMKGAALMAIACLVSSCNHDAWKTKPQEDAGDQTASEFATNFSNIVMGGKAVDPTQTWNTAATSNVRVSVNLNYGENYTVYITESNPLTDANATYLGKAVVASGSTQTITLMRPAGVGGYFAALYDKKGHAIVKPFAMESNATAISFGESAAASRSARRAASTGNRWSVAAKSMPALTAYTTGTTAISESNNNTLPDNPVSKYVIPKGTTWSANIPRIQAYAGQSVYVEGTWNVSADQRCTGGSVIVVGPNGVVNVASGHLLSTNANNNEGTTGMIYVMPGGKITGDGQLQFSNGTETFSYNGGVITVKDININGGTLYNAGTIGGVTGENNPALTGPAGTPEYPSTFINMGHATLASIGGAGIAVENACNLNVIGQMELGKSSKMDGGSYTECGSLKLAGSNNGDITMYMGPAAYLKNKGDLNVNNYGVWGPTSGSNAIFEISNEVSYANMTQNAPGTQMLDHVELIIPEDYPAEIQNGGYSTNHAGYVIYGWFNGLNFTTINPDAFVWEQNYDKYGDWNNHNTNVANKNSWTYTNNANVTDDRRTCLLGTSPSYEVEADEDGCGTGFTPGTNKKPENSYIYFAFEDLGTSDDFDFNDVVVRVATPDENGRSTVELCAIGGTLRSTIYCGNQQIGSEVHTYGEFGANTKVKVGVPIATIGEVAVAEGTSVADLDIKIKVTRLDGSIVTVARPVAGDTPCRVAVAGDAEGKWHWPLERHNISDAYPDFGEWGANYSSNADWYKNYVESRIVKW